MSAAEILEELPLLTAAERAEVRAKLDTLDDVAGLPAIAGWGSDLPTDAVEAVAELRRREAFRRQQRLGERE